MKKFNVTFTIGTGFDTNGKVITPLESKELTHKTFFIVAKAYGGYTAINTEGGWIDDKGFLVQEKSLRVESLTESKNLETVTIQAETLAFSLCALWNQNCVVCEVKETTFNFIAQNV